MLDGYQDKLLRIDLDKHHISTSPLDRRMVDQFIGGRGFIAKILHDELPSGIDARVGTGVGDGNGVGSGACVAVGGDGDGVAGAGWLVQALKTTANRASTRIILASRFVCLGLFIFFSSSGNTTSILCHHTMSLATGSCLTI